MVLKKKRVFGHVTQKVKSLAGFNMANGMESAPDAVQCPVCLKDFASGTINGHLDVCLTDRREPPLKKPRLGSTAEPPGVKCPGSGSSSAAAPPSSPLFSMFKTSKSKASGPGERNASLSTKQPAASAVKTGVKRNLSGEEEPGHEATEEVQSQHSGANRQTVKASRELSPRALMTSNRPLAESLRPSTLEEYFGQNKVVGQQTLLRSLLDSQEVPSLILWGPPGCGKVKRPPVLTSKTIRKTPVNNNNNQLLELVFGVKDIKLQIIFITPSSDDDFLINLFIYEKDKC